MMKSVRASATKSLDRIQLNQPQGNSRHKASDDDNPDTSLLDSCGEWGRQMKLPDHGRTPGDKKAVEARADDDATRTSDSPVSPHDTVIKELVSSKRIDERKGLQYAECRDAVSICRQLLLLFAGLHVVSFDVRVLGC